MIMGKRGPKTKFYDQACPNDCCKDYGLSGRDNIIGNGTYKSKNGRIRKYICLTCGKNFSDRTNTAFYDLRTTEDKILTALKLVVKGLPLRAIADVLDVKLDTVRGWLQRAAEHCDEVNEILMKDLNVDKVELDELWTFVKKKKFRNWRKKMLMNAGFG